MVMGRNGHGPIWLWADLVMGRNDPESDGGTGFYSLMKELRPFTGA